MSDDPHRTTERRAAKTAPRSAALLVTADDEVLQQATAGLARDNAVRALRRARSLEAAKAVVAGADVVVVLADPRLPDATAAEVGDWLRDLEQPALVLVPHHDADACVPALGTDLPSHVLAPAAPWQLLASAVHHAIEIHREDQGLAGSYADWRDRLATIRHEMATPISAIEGFIEALIAHGDRLPADRRRDSLEAAYRNAGRLRRLASELNAVAKATGPAADTNLGMVELRPALRRLVKDFGPRAERVTVAVPSDLWALVDTDHLGAIVNNLIDNALKYGEAPIEVKARLHEGRVQIAVIDHGPGVPDHFVPRMFERYTRAHEVRDQRRGSGIGLALCADLADAMGGTLRYQQAADGGSVFVLEVLATRDVEADARALSPVPAAVAAPEEAEGVAPEAEAPVEPAAAAVVEDEPVAAEVVQVEPAVATDEVELDDEDVATPEPITVEADEPEVAEVDEPLVAEVAEADEQDDLVIDVAAVEAENLRRAEAETARAGTVTEPVTRIHRRPELPAFDALAYEIVREPAHAAGTGNGNGNGKGNGTGGAGEHGTSVDHGSASNGAGNGHRRPIAGDLRVTNDGLRTHTKVELGIDGRDVVGEATGASTAESSGKAVVRATLDALETFLEGSARFDVERVRLQDEGPDRYVLVTVTSMTSDGFERLVGAALAHDDPQRAAMYATLDALNRRIERLLV